MRERTVLTLVLFIVLLNCISETADTQPAQPNSCEAVVNELNLSLSPKIDEKELVTVLILI